MHGAFTRFGEILPLLTETDHRLAVIGSGDEITLRFKVPDNPVPDGWTRDFVLHCVGWDKDANLHTIYGQSVEPLPFVGMSSYPSWIDQQTPHPKDYLKNYQTRRCDLPAFQQAFRRDHLSNLTESSN